MFRVWMKIIKDTRLLRDTVVEIDDPEETRTHKVYQALEEGCHRLDLSIPIWLELNKKDFIRHAHTRFTADSFIEPIDFDHLEFRVIEEDHDYASN